MEDSQSITTVRVGHVVSELTQFGIYRTDIRVERWADRGFLQVKPITVSIRACRVVAYKDVIWVRDPEASWGLIGVQKTP